ncbi:MAG: hypothetical protein R3C11_03170 [Planctomycetaceae bacterium]
MTFKDYRPINILLVEDDDDDVRLIMRNLKNDRVANVVQRAKDGVDAMEYLRQQGNTKLPFDRI